MSEARNEGEAQRVMKAGGRYNWRNQPERLIYIGRSRERGQSRWHQFQKVDEPAGTVWCEVLDSDLHMIEETPITTMAEFCAEAERTGLTAATLAEALSKRPEFADCLPNAAATPTDGGTPQ